MLERQGKGKAILIAMIGVLSISVAAPLFKLASPTHPLVASAWRLSIAGLIWSILANRTLKLVPLSQQERRVGLWAGLCYAIHFGAWVWSLELTSVASSTTLVTTTPLMLALIGAMTGRDAPSLRAWWGVSIALLGVIVLTLTHSNTKESSEQAWIGDGLALLGAAAMALYFLKVRTLGVAVRLAPLSMLATLGGAFWLWITCLFILPLSSLLPNHSMAFIALFGAALIPQLIGHAALTESLKSLTPTEVSSLTLFEPIGASLLAWLWLGEPMTFELTLLCLMTLIGVKLTVS